MLYKSHIFRSDIVSSKLKVMEVMKASTAILVNIPHIIIRITELTIQTEVEGGLLIISFHHYSSLYDSVWGSFIGCKLWLLNFSLSCLSLVLQSLERK